MRVVFMGTPEFAVPALEALLNAHEVAVVVTQPDRPAGRKRQLRSPPVKVVAERAGVTVLQPTSVRTTPFLDAMRETNADVAVVVAYGKILPKSVLDAFPHGCINIHGSLLPKYRGAAPIQQAILADELETGISIMRLDEGMDTGPVLLRVIEPITENDSAGRLLARLAPIGATALLRVLRGLEAGTLESVAQDEGSATHAAMLQKCDGIVDWSNDAAAVAARIRGVDPWPGAVTFFRTREIKIFGARVCDGQGPPGTVLASSTDGLVVACGHRAVRIAEMQASGKKRMSAHSFVNGGRLAVGAVLSTSKKDD